METCGVDEDGNFIVVNSGTGSQTSTGPFGICLGTGASGGTNYIYFAALNRSTSTKRYCLS